MKRQFTGVYYDHYHQTVPIVDTCQSSYIELTQVVFTITDNSCGVQNSKTEYYYRMYDKVAEASGGLVFRLGKGDVEEVAIILFFKPFLVLY